MEFTQDEILRFKSRFVEGNKDDCWEWQGTIHKKGYGVFCVKSTNFHAHRIGYMMLVGPVSEGLCVLHKCDNRRCVNPNHLFLGTNYDNVQDREQKGRGKFVRLVGDEHPGRKLTNAGVCMVRELHAKGQYTQKQLADAFGVSLSLICGVIKGKKRPGVTKEQS